MNTASNKPNPRDEDDSWEALAENLFGIDFARHADADELISPEELFPEEPVETQPQDELARDESTGEGRAGELAEEADSPELQQKPAAAGDDEDACWDALRAWASEGEAADEEHHWTPAKAKRRKKEPRRAEEPAGRETARPEPGDVSEPDEPEEEFIEDTDFAAGLLEEEARPRRRARPAPPMREELEEEERPAKRAAAEAEEEEEEEREETERERRPRRRRRRARRPKAAEAETAAVSPREPEPGFAAPEEEPERAELEPEEEERRGRGRRRRRRPAAAGREETAVQRAPEEQAEDEEVLVDWKAEPILDSTAAAEDEEDEEREAVAAYGNIPSWEEAISCLVNPRRTEGRASETGGERSSERGGSRRRRRR